jgi:hypothetical protein
MLFLSAGFFSLELDMGGPSDYAYELGLVVEERRVMVILGIQLSFFGFTNHLLQNMGHKLWLQNTPVTTPSLGISEFANLFSLKGINVEA